MTASDCMQFLDRFGIAVTVLAAIAFASWRVVKFLGRKLFDDEKGLVTRSVEAHICAVDNLTKSYAELSSLGHTIPAALAKAESRWERQDQIVEHATRALELIAQKHGVDIAEPVGRIRLLLRDHHPRNHS